MHLRVNDVLAAPRAVFDHIISPRSQKNTLKRKAPARLSRRAQFQLWIFSYTTRGRPSKKCLSRLLFALAQKFPPD